MSGKTKDDRNEALRNTAIIHAKQIQNQKDISLLLLEATETLIDYPLKTSSAGSPSIEDVLKVKSLLITFQPEDFDALIEERNISGKCGYVLCPLPHRTEKGAGVFRILQHHGKVDIVETKKLEMWCSEQCRRRAMYVRIQLLEDPAWLRQGHSVKLELLEEKEQKRENRKSQVVVTDWMEKLNLSTGQPKSGSTTLNESQISEKLMKLDIRETTAPENSKAPKPPRLEESGGHMAIDGFNTMTNTQYRKGKLPKSKDDDDDDGDWGLL
jgi:hypothetical protein